jgi:hypothetical protein
MKKISTAKKVYHTVTGCVLESHHKPDIEKAMIEFAKLHVEAALKEASEKARTKDVWEGNTGSEYCDTVIDTDSIINCYPLDNIK